MPLNSEFEKWLKSDERFETTHVLGCTNEGGELPFETCGCHCYERGIFEGGYLSDKEILKKQLGHKQFEIDSLMLEYCPEDMSADQLDNWAKRQKRSNHG